MQTANQKTIKSYDKIARQFADAHPDRLFWKKQFDFFTGVVPGKKIIDIGCGEGRDALLFIDNGFDYTGIDASAAMIREAKKNVPGGKFIKMDFYDLKFLPRSFDCFWAAASILHAPKRRVVKLLRGIGRIIKTGGTGFISLQEIGKIGEGMVAEQRYGGVERYFSYYDKSEFAVILENAGFRVVASDVVAGNGKNWLCFFVRK